MLLQKFRANFLGGQLNNMAIEYLKLLFWIFICFFNIVLYLLNKLVVALVGISGMATLVGDTAAGASFGFLFFIRFFFLGAALLGVISSRAVNRLIVGAYNLRTARILILKILNINMDHLYPVVSGGTE